MIHPTQQQGYARKTPPACIAITRAGKTRRYEVNPLFAAVAFGGLAAVATGFIGATGYLIYRDDIIGGALGRQIELQYQYEDRIAALRTELDRVTSRHAVQSQGVEAQLSTLLERQAVIEARQQRLAGLATKARSAGVEIAWQEARAPRPRPGADDDRTPTMAASALAYSSASTTKDIISGVLIRGSETGAPAVVGRSLQPVFSEVQSSLEAAEGHQTSMLAGLSDATDQKARKLARALERIGLGGEAGHQDGPKGGPFIPAEGLHFVEQAAMLDRSLDVIGTLRGRAAALPLTAPMSPQAVSSRFGYRMDPFLRRPALHAGMDFAAAAGTVARATAPGTVISAGWAGGYGLMVEVSHAKGVTTRFGHLSEVLVKAGDAVSTGSPVGRVGSTGRSTGPHLHYETRSGGKAVDPALYLAAGAAL